MQSTSSASESPDGSPYTGTHTFASHINSEPVGVQVQIEDDVVQSDSLEVWWEGKDVSPLLSPSQIESLIDLAESSRGDWAQGSGEADYVFRLGLFFLEPECKVKKK